MWRVGSSQQKLRLYLQTTFDYKLPLVVYLCGLKREKGKTQQLSLKHLKTGLGGFVSSSNNIDREHRYRKSLNRLLKVCYVPATSAVLIAFFSSFLLQSLTVLMKQTRQPVRAVKQSIYLDVYDQEGSLTNTERKSKHC
jgi:hypothetical protein